MRKLLVDNLLELLNEGLPPEMTPVMIETMKLRYGKAWGNVSEMFTKKDIMFFQEQEQEHRDLLHLGAIGILLWLANGRYVLVPNEDLIVALLHTDLQTKIEVSDIQWRYPVFYIAFPEKKFVITVPNKPGYLWVDGVLVCRQENNKIVLMIYYNIEGYQEEAEEFWWSICPVSLTVSGSLSSWWDRIEKEELSFEKKEIIRLVINFLLFLSLPRDLLEQEMDENYVKLQQKLARLHPQKQRQKANRIREQLNAQTPSQVVHFKPRYLNKFSSNTGGNKHERPLNTREETRKRNLHIVRGHFRNQPYGKGRKLRKIVWIHPHFRGTPNTKADTIIRVK